MKKAWSRLASAGEGLEKGRRGRFVWFGSCSLTLMAVSAKSPVAD